MCRGLSRSVWWALGAVAVACFVCGVGCVTDGQARRIPPSAGGSGPAAGIKVSCGGSGELVFRNLKTKAVRKLESNDSTFRLPSGSYQVLTYTSLGKDAGGKAWGGMSNLSSTSRGNVTLGVEEETLKAGPPYHARVAVTQRSGGMVSFDLKFRDSGGAPCRVAAARGRVANPRFSVEDADGRVVLTGKFEYG